MKLFYVEYIIAIRCETYVVCEKEEDIRGVIAQRFNSCSPNEISVMSVRETNLQMVNVSDLTVGDLLKLIKQ